MHRIQRHTVVGTLLFTLVVGSVVPAFAAPPVPKGKKEAEKPKTLSETLPPDARKHFESALLLYENSNWEGALTEFRAAYDMSKEPKVLQNVAVCEKNLKRYSQAITTLQQALAEGTGFDAELQTKIKDQIDILMPLTSLIVIEVAEPGAEVSVDGRVLGTTPLTGNFRVDVGERTVLVKKAGFVDATKKVNIAGSTTITVKIELEPTVKWGQVSVTVQGLAAGARAKVTVDGTEMGEAPWQANLPAGKHTFEVSSPGYVSKKVTKDIEYKQVVTLDLSLEKERHEGLLAIETGVADASIALDGKIVGTGSFKGVVPSGGHQVQVNADGYKPYSSEVSILDNQTRSVSVQLEKNSKTWLWLTGGGLALAGLGIGGYFLFRPKDEQPVPGTISPGVVTVPLFR